MEATMQASRKLRLSKRDLKALDLYFRAANYLVAAQLYLKDNVFLERPIRPEDIKDPVLGHWGTAPGINYLYAHVNRLVRDHSRDVLPIIGPGHAAASVLANLYIEGTLSNYYPDLTQDRDGLNTFVRNFGLRDGFPTELSPLIPGCLHPGGELGHALSVAYGTVFDRRDLITLCVVGDGEAETAPTAAAWQSNKFLNPAESGTVLPVLHLNGHRLTSPSIYGSMTNQELTKLFEGLGFAPKIVEGGHLEMSASLEWALEKIDENTSQAGKDLDPASLQWPMILLRTQKGWTGPAWFRGRRIEGTHRSHKAPISDAATDPEARRILEDWLRSYQPQEIFDESGRLSSNIKSVLPEPSLRLGMTAARIAESRPQKLRIPPWEQHAVEVRVPGAAIAKSAEVFGRMLRSIVRVNRESKNFRIFSPDELDSNQLGEVLEETGRCFVRGSIDSDAHFDPNGRIMEVLSEHLIQGWFQGYTATGSYGVLASYECFVPIISSMLSQHAKFLTEYEESGRPPMPSLNYFLTSLGWHNNYSHQNPDFYTTLLSWFGSFVRLYFPPDANTLLACSREVLVTHGRINVIAAAKTALPQWLNPSESENLARRGIALWSWAGTPIENEPDLIFAGCGDYATRECLNAIHFLRTTLPALRIRYVSICELTQMGSRNQFTHALSDDEFEHFFTRACPVFLLFNGYASGPRALLFERPNANRFKVLGYQDRGANTTPVDMHVRNSASRFDLTLLAIDQLWREGIIAGDIRERMEHECRFRLKLFQDHIAKYRRDPDDEYSPMTNIETR